MYKILITTSYVCSNGVSVATTVTEFDTPGAALYAVHAINVQTFHGGAMSQRAKALFDCPNDGTYTNQAR